MIHVRNSLLDLHIRTAYRGRWSAIETLALKIGADIMEVEQDGTVLINGAAPPPSPLLDTYAVSIGPFLGTGRRTVTVLLDGGQYLEFATYDNNINIYIDANGSDFCDSEGMAGNWQLDGFISRDGVTPVSPLDPGSNKVEYGIEWEVNAGLGDPILFSTPTTKNCAVEPSCDTGTPNDELCTSSNKPPDENDLKQARAICEDIVTNPLDLDACAFDVAVEGKQWVLDNTLYERVLEPTIRCVPADIEEPPVEEPPDERDPVPDVRTNPEFVTCADLGGECVYRCNPEISDCIEGDNLCVFNLVAIGDRRFLQEEEEDFVEGCSCAVPKDATPEPTPCPSDGDGIPPIAGYLPRTDPAECLNWDLIQEELEEIMDDQSCTSLEDGEVFYLAGDGMYFQDIPSFVSPQSDVFNEYTKYYGKDDFMKTWVKKAFKQTQTNFVRGNAKFGDAFPNNFANCGECVGFEEVIKKGTAYTGQLVNSYQLVQKAIEEVNGGCYAQVDGCTDAIEAIDCAVAAYVGSLEGNDGNNDPAGDYGKGPYALGDKRCRNFKTCGPTRDGDAKDLTAAVNIQVLSLFAGASHAAWVGDGKLIEVYLRLISNKSIIPLLQGTLRYYYLLSDEESGPGTFSTLDKYVGEGGAFAFGALPKLWACSGRGAKKAEAQTKIGGGIAGTSAVQYEDLRLSFECNYRCLGITCDEVGSFYNGGTSPKPGATACDDEDNGSDNVCAKPKKSRKTQCKLFTGKPGVKNRDKLRFTF